MSIRLLFIFFLLAGKIEGFAQGYPTLTLKHFYTSIQRPDTAEFINYFLSSEEITEIFKSVILDTLDVSGKETGNSNDYLIYLNNEYHRIGLKADSLNLILSNSKYVCVKYEIVNDPQYFFPSLTGSIFIKATDKIFEIQIGEAIFINESWKITKLGSLNQVIDTSLLLKNKQKISAFNSLNFDVKVTDIKVEEVNKLPPPPPPPPPKRKKTS